MSPTTIWRVRRKRLRTTPHELHFFELQQVLMIVLRLAMMRPLT